ncbi:hypothetical protein U9M48_029179 [Paspalum notatum var. saurae]|uniref:Uncharacterized protein n=1 Tax=Paspalum notatum var. saurae TaxID=547442 RepID=A0AAQ3U0Y2_PASNO
MDAGGGAVAASGGLDDADAAFFSRRGHRCCGCFWAPPWASSPSSASPHARRATTGEEWWHRVGEAGRRRWWRRGVDALMKVREWSELVAGPRWKTFIRRFRRSSSRHAAGCGGGKLNYDPLSYALNFDDGHGGGGGPNSPEGGDYAGFRDFSARFVAQPGSAKTSMDLGVRDAPPFLLHHHHHPHSPRPPPAAAAARA